MSYFKIIQRPESRRGFTLIELLVVIVIIGILASLVMVGGTAVRKSARQGLIKTEIAQVAMALESYKNKYGEYPPDFSDEKAVMRHVRKRWPLCQISETEFYDNIEDAGWEIDTNNSHGIGHVGALALWLGGPFDETRGMLGGWGLDASDPFNLDQREEPMMEFSIGRNLAVKEINGKEVYAVVANNQPMVYFRPTAVGYLTSNGKSGSNAAYNLRHVCDEADEGFGCAVPYIKSLSNDFFDSGTGDPNSLYVNSEGEIKADGAKAIVWHNPTSYQIIHPGMDGIFGLEDSDKPFEGLLRIANPADDDMKYCTLEDSDNQANFGGTTIETGGN